MISKWAATALAALSADSDSDAERRRVQIRAFRRFLLLHGSVRSLLWLWFGAATSASGFGGPLAVGSSLAICCALVLSFLPRWELLAPRIALLALVCQGYAVFPATDNHFVLELLAVMLLSLVTERSRRDEQLVLVSLRWLVVLVLFHTGLSKVLYGHYFQGDFLAFMIGQGGRFADFFGFLISTSEIERLQAYDPLRTGQGPYRVESLWLTLLSNGVWIAEIGLAALLVVRRTRFLAALAAIALVAGIEVGAREFGFGILFVNLLLLFSADGNRRVLPIVAALYLYVLGAVLGWLPGGHWIDPGWL